jgi:CopG family nickel-responsive transcriptional regulator
VQRITISIDDDLAEAFDALVKLRGYQSRSEGVRDLVREAVQDWRADQPGSTYSVANLSYIYDRRTRVLAQRLSELRHDHHDLIAAVAAIHLDHDHTLESVMLKGETDAVRAFADRLRAERGVRFGAVNLIDVAAHDHHEHDHAHSHSGHAHLSPQRG